MFWSHWWEGDILKSTPMVTVNHQNQASRGCETNSKSAHSSDKNEDLFSAAGRDFKYSCTVQALHGNSNWEG